MPSLEEGEGRRRRRRGSRERREDETNSPLRSSDKCRGPGLDRNTLGLQPWRRGQWTILIYFKFFHSVYNEHFNIRA